MTSPSPYDARPEKPIEAQIVEPPSQGSLSLITSLAITLAVLGLLGLCLSGGIVVSNVNATGPTAPAAGATAMQRFEYELQKEWLGITQRYMPALVTFLALQVLAVALLFIGAIRLARRRPAGRRFMLGVLLFMIAFEALRAGLYVVMMLEMMPLVDASLHRALQRAGGQGPEMAAMIKRMAQGATLAAILVALVWPGLKLLFYGWAARYLTSREARELCASQ